MEKQLPTSVPADGDNGDGLRRSRRTGADLTDDRIEAIGETRQRPAATVPAENLISQFTSRFVELYRIGMRLERAGLYARGIGHGGVNIPYTGVKRPS